MNRYADFNPPTTDRWNYNSIVLHLLVKKCVRLFFFDEHGIQNSQIYNKDLHSNLFKKHVVIICIKVKARYRLFIVTVRLNRKSLTHIAVGLRSLNVYIAYYSLKSL